MSQTKAELIKGLNINASAPATALNIDSSGRVGIGTTSPVGDGTALHIHGTTYSTLHLTNGTTGQAATDGFEIVTDGSDVIVRNRESGNLIVQNAGNEAFRVDSSRRLLVGTSTSVLNRIAGNLQVVGTGEDSCVSLSRYSTSDSGSPVLAIGRSRSATPGTNTVVVSGDRLGEIAFTGTDGTSFISAAAIQAFVDGTPSANDLPGRLVFSTTADGASSPTERMRIDNQGRVETTCVKNDNVAFVVSHNGTSGLQYCIAAVTANDQNDATRYFFRGQGGVTERFTVRSNGGIANYSASNVNLSDVNTKKDISPASDTWNCIKEWEIVNYRYKDQPDDADLNVGVIAQQVAESCPEVITVFSEAKEAKPAVLDDDGNEVEPPQEAQSEKLGVKEQQMYWMAIKALQEAQVRIETLEAEVAALKVS